MKSTSEHHIELPGGDFRLWRWSALRGTGFPASMVLHLGAPELARAADARIAAEDAFARARDAAVTSLNSAHRVSEAEQNALRAVRKGVVPDDTGTDADDAIRAMRVAASAVAETAAAFREAHAAARLGISRQLQLDAANARFREAVTWQNRAAVDNAFESVVRADPAKQNARARQHEALVVRYLQRYCTKNDTIGFFGPLGWARWSDEPEAIVVTPERELLAARDVYFEQWPIDALAAQASDDARLRPWRTARRYPFVTWSDGRVESPLSGRHEISAAEAELLDACDGAKTTRDLAHDGRWGDEEAVSRLLQSLSDKKLVFWGFEVPLTWNPEKALRRVFSLIDDEALRIERISTLDALDAARAKVAASAGDGTAVANALSELDGVFTAATGLAASREAGSTYAGRQLVFEDCRRAGAARLGTKLLAELGPPLSLVLASARWMSHETAQAYRRALRALYEDLASRAGSPVVSFLELWMRAQRLLFGTKDRPVDRVAADLEQRWSTILDAPAGERRVSFRSEDLRARVESLFDAPDPGWRGACHHSPDVMIAASSVEAIRRGDYALVLGELHAAINTLDTQVMLALHPDVAEIDAVFAEDLPGPRVVPNVAKDWRGTTVRTNSPLKTPGTTVLETSLDVADAPRDRVVGLNELVVSEVDGQLVVRLGPGRGDERRFEPLEIVEVFGQLLGLLVCDGFRVRPKRTKAPRVTFDKLVVCREAWSFPPSALAFADAKDDEQRFLEARRWALSAGLPRFLFVKSEVEFKPMYVDLESPLFVSMLAKLARAASADAAGAKPLAFTEMLPALDETWLVDASGAGYTSEIRIVAVDRRGPPGAEAGR